MVIFTSHSHDLYHPSNPHSHAFPTNYRRHLWYQTPWRKRTLRTITGQRQKKRDNETLTVHHWDETWDINFWTLLYMEGIMWKMEILPRIRGMSMMSPSSTEMRTGKRRMKRRTPWFLAKPGQFFPKILTWGAWGKSMLDLLPAEVALTGKTHVHLNKWEAFLPHHILGVGSTDQWITLW